MKKTYLCWFVFLLTVFQLIEYVELKLKKKHPHYNIRHGGQKRHDEKNASSSPKDEEPDFDYVTSVSSSKFSHEHKQSKLLSSNVTAIFGHNTMLTCSVKNLGSYNILWLRVKDGDVLAFDDMLITQDTRFRLVKKSPSESNLIIQSVRSSDAGEYACQINTIQVKSKFINLIVFKSPAFSQVELTNNDQQFFHSTISSSYSLIEQSNDSNIKIYSHNHNRNHPKSIENTDLINVIEGKDAVLECMASGFPKPTVNWYVKRFNSNNFTVYILNSTKINLYNVMRRQYDLFECEASNKIPPTITKKFKIQVLFRPEITIVPIKKYAEKLSQINFNCTVNSFPDSNIVWMKNYRDLKNLHKISKHSRETILTTGLLKDQSNVENTNSYHYTNKKLRSKKTRKNLNKYRIKWINRNPRNQIPNHDEEIDHSINKEESIQNYVLNSSSEKYIIRDFTFNETHKISMLTINVDSDEDFGVYECFSNNTAGSKSEKFYVYEALNKPDKASKEVDSLSKSKLVNLEISNPRNLNEYLEQNSQDLIESKMTYENATKSNNLFHSSSIETKNNEASLYESIFASKNSSSSSASYFRCTYTFQIMLITLKFILFLIA